MKILGLLIFTYLALTPSWCAPVREEDPDVLDEANLPDGIHQHSDLYRGAKLFQNNQFRLGDIDVSGQLKGDDVSIGSQVDIDVKTPSFQSVAHPTESAVPVDCLWSEYTDWSLCSVSCGDGTRQRKRHIATPAKGGGNPCVGEKVETESCNTGPCTGFKLGDMLLSPEQLDFLKLGLLDGELDGWTPEKNANVEANAIKDPNRKWPNSEVVFSFKDNVSFEDKEKVRQVLNELQNKLDGCITFRENYQAQNRVIVSTNGPGCYAHVGYYNTPLLKKSEMDYQEVNLGNGCMSDGIIEHEFLHAIGLYHTQCRSDRDEYVRIIMKNIPLNDQHNFNKYNARTVSHHGLPYDYDSVMHYGKSEFAFKEEDGQITIETKNPSYQDVIGQRDGVSLGDIELIKRAYNCNSKGILKEDLAGMSEQNSQVSCPGCLFPSEVDEEILLAAKFAVKALEGNSTVSNCGGISLVKVVKAETQVVAGRNYHLTLRLEMKSGDNCEEDVEKICENIVVHKPLPFNCQSMECLELIWKEDISCTQAN
jgi:hypothetical protein